MDACCSSNSRKASSHANCARRDLQGQHTSMRLCSRSRHWLQCPGTLPPRCVGESRCTRWSATMNIIWLIEHSAPCFGTLRKRRAGRNSTSKLMMSTVVSSGHRPWCRWYGWAFTGDRSRAGLTQRTAGLTWHSSTVSGGSTESRHERPSTP